jgi:DNA-binding transcriptional ArsR family regulator
LEPFPDDLKRFLDGNIEAIEQLEILRLLGDNPDKEWGTAALARDVQAPQPVVVAHVAALYARGLLQSENRGGEVVCRHGARTPELQALVARLLQLYRERPVTMIRMVYSRSDPALRSFSDAFRLRKEE